MSVNSSNKISVHKEIKHFAIMAIIIAIFFICPPFSAELTPIGMRLLGVFIASCYGWTAIGLTWPTIFCFCLLPFTGACTAGELLVAGTGNTIFLFLMFIFMLNVMIEESGLATFIANWMMSRKALQGRPWAIILVFMFAAAFCTMLSSNIFLVMFLMWSIAMGMCESIGYGPKEPLPVMLITVTTCCCLMGYSIMPYQGIALILTNGFQTITGIPIPFGTYLAFSLPMAYGTVLVMWLILKTIFRKIDVSKLKMYDVTAVDPKLLQLSTKGKIILGDLLIFVLLILLGGILPATNLIARFTATVGNFGVIALCMLPLLFIKIDEERIWDIQHTFSRGVRFDILIVCAFILPLGTYMANGNAGISAWFLAILQPLMGSMTPIALAVCVCVTSLILTQFMTNMVVAYMFFPVIFALSQQMAFNPVPQALVAIYICHVAILIPAACSYAAMTHAHTWVSSRSVTKYGLAFVLAGLVMCVFGYAYANFLI